MSFLALALGALSWLPLIPGLPLSAAAQAEAAPIEFHAGDVAQLDARIISAERITKSKHGSLLWVEVTNGSPWVVEPLSFLVEGRERRGDLTGENRVIERVRGLGFGRAGRVMLPGTSLRYPLVVAAPPMWAKLARYNVQSASFSSGTTGVADPLVTVAQPTSLDADSHSTTLQIRCDLEHPVDAIFQATFQGKNAGLGLLFARLEPNSDAPFTFSCVPTSCVPDVGFDGAAVAEMELVDWSVALDEGAEKAGEILRACWSRRAHLQDEQLNFVATCRVSVEHYLAVAGKRERVEFKEQSCRIGFDAAGRLVLVAPGELSPRERSLVESCLERVECPASQRRVPGRVGEVALAQLGSTTLIRLADKNPRFVVLENDRVRSLRSSLDDRGLGENWTTSEREGHWYLDAVQISGLATPSGSKPLGSADKFASSLIWSWSASGPPLPTRLDVRSGPLGAFPILLTIDFTGWTQE